MKQVLGKIRACSVNLNDTNEFVVRLLSRCREVGEALSFNFLCGRLAA